MPKFWCSRLASDLVIKIAPASSTTDSVACSTTSAFCGAEERSRVERLTPRSASAGCA